MGNNKLLRWTPMLHRWIRRSGLAFVVVWTLISIGQRLELSKSDWAAWVQAVGSVAAIFAAAFAVWWQVRLQGKAERRFRVQQEIDALSSVRALFRYASDCIGHAFVCCNDSTKLKHYLGFTFDLNELHHVRTALEETHVSEMPSPSMKMAFLSGRDYFVAALQTLHEMREAMRRDERHIDDRNQVQHWQGRLSHDHAGLALRCRTVGERIEELESEIESD